MRRLLALLVFAFVAVLACSSACGGGPCEDECAFLYAREVHCKISVTVTVIGNGGGGGGGAVPQPSSRDAYMHACAAATGDANGAQCVDDTTANASCNELAATWCPMVAKEFQGPGCSAPR